MSLVVALLSCI